MKIRIKSAGLALFLLGLYVLLCHIAVILGLLWAAVHFIRKFW